MKDTDNVSVVGGVAESSVVIEDINQEIFDTLTYVSSRF